MRSQKYTLLVLFDWIEYSLIMPTLSLVDEVKLSHMVLKSTIVVLLVIDFVNSICCWCSIQGPYTQWMFSLCLYSHLCHE